MDTTLRELRKHVPQVAEQFASARSAANRRTRRKEEREEETRVRRLRRATQRRLREQEREAATRFRGRVRVRVDKPDRPRVGLRTSRKLHSRDDPYHIIGKIGSPVFTGPDGCQSVHFQFLARGLAGSKGTPWLRGSAARKLQYITRYEALEDGIASWWSNIGEDRAELTAFGQVIEALERHDRKNANVFCEEIIALPYELSTAQRRKCVEHICLAISARGLPFAVGIHKPDPKGDQRNFHCHLVYSLRPTRRLEGYHWDFETQKVSDINTPVGIRARRQAVTTALNVALAKAGIAKRYTDKSHAARGIITPPGRKRGQALTAIYRKRQAEEEAAAKGPAVTAPIERKIMTARDVANLASDAAASLEGAYATLQATGAAVRETVVEMQEAVQSATARARDAATLAKDAIDQMHRRTVEQITAARARLHAARAHISRDTRLVRSAVAKAGMDFSQIDHPDHLQAVMHISQSEGLKSQTSTSAITEQTHIAFDLSDPAHEPQPIAIPVPASKQTPEGPVTIVDIRSLDDEVVERPAPGTKNDIDETVERTLEQSSSGDSAPAIDKAEVGRGEDDNEAITSLETGGATNSIVALLQGTRREPTPQTIAPTPATPRPKVAASRKPQEIEGDAPNLSSDLQPDEAAVMKRKAEAQAGRDAEEPARVEAEAEEKPTLAAQAIAPAEAKAQPCYETEAAQAKAEPPREEKAPGARTAEDGGKRHAAEEEAPREAEAQRQKTGANRAHSVIPAPPVERPATTPSEPVMAPPVPQPLRQTRIELAPNTAVNRPANDGEAVVSRRALGPDAQLKPNTTNLRDDLVQNRDSALSSPPSPQPVQPEASVPAEAAQRPRTLDEMSREELEQIREKLVAKETQIRAVAAGIPIGQFREFPLPDQITLCGGAGLPHQDELRLAAITGLLSKLPKVAPPVCVSEPARPQMSSPAPAQPAPKPPVKDDLEGMTRQQFDSRRKGGFGRD